LSRESQSFFPFAMAHHCPLVCAPPFSEKTLWPFLLLVWYFPSPYPSEMFSFTPGPSHFESGGVFDPPVYAEGGTIFFLFLRNTLFAFCAFPLICNSSFYRSGGSFRAHLRIPHHGPFSLFPRCYRALLTQRTFLLRVLRFTPFSKMQFLPSQFSAFPSFLAANFF